MLYQTSPTLVLVPMPPEPEGPALIGVYNFLSNEFATCTTDVLCWLSLLLEARTLAEVSKHRPDLPASEAESQITALVELGLVAEKETDRHDINDMYRQVWEWDSFVAAFHFSSLNTKFMSLDESVAHQLQKLECSEQPPSTGLCFAGEAFELPPIGSSMSTQHLQLLARRRTNRVSANYTLAKQDIGDCLFAAFGITHYVKTPAGERPLSLAPSGGARNPYEAFVIIRRCDSLKAGVYHYSSTRHDLVFVNELPDDFAASQLFGNQEWTDDMAAIVILVALLERSMWKYQDSNAYRVMLIEAGHRAQNFLSTATQLGLTACPTAALAHEKIRLLLKLKDPLLHTPVYALTLDKALPLHDQITPTDFFKSAFATDTK